MDGKSVRGIGLLSQSPCQQVEAIRTDKLEGEKQMSMKKKLARCILHPLLRSHPVGNPTVREHVCFGCCI